MEAQRGLGRIIWLEMAMEEPAGSEEQRKVMVWWGSRCVAVTRNGWR